MLYDVQVNYPFETQMYNTFVIFKTNSSFGRNRFETSF